MLFGKKKKDEEFFLSNARNLSSITLPKDYFIAQYMSWMDDSLSTEQRIKSYHELKSLYKTQDLDNFLDTIKSVAETHQRTPVPVFFTSSEEWQQFKEIFQENANDTVSELMITSLRFVSLAISEHRRFGRLCSICFNIDDSMSVDKVSSLSIDAFFFAIEIKWKEICAAYPRYNTPKYYNQFRECVKQDSVSLNNWQEFYVHSIMKVRDDFGAHNWVKYYVDILEQAQQKYSFIYDPIKGNGFSEYSAIYEISDFSQEELKRIISLYESGVLNGVYRKANDPKYQ